jgi:hypothetical protein
MALVPGLSTNNTATSDSSQRDIVPQHGPRGDALPPTSTHHTCDRIPRTHTQRRSSRPPSRARIRTGSLFSYKAALVPRKMAPKEASREPVPATDQVGALHGLVLKTPGVARAP